MDKLGGIGHCVGEFLKMWARVGLKTCIEFKPLKGLYGWEFKHLAKFQWNKQDIQEENLYDKIQLKQ